MNLIDKFTKDEEKTTIENEPAAVASSSTSLATTTPLQSIKSNKKADGTYTQEPNEINLQSVVRKTISISKFIHSIVSAERDCPDDHKKLNKETEQCGEQSKVTGNQSFKSSIAFAQEGEKCFGCAHYRRRALFVSSAERCTFPTQLFNRCDFVGEAVTPCCNKFYKCRFCHDENETHHFDRKTLTELICSECNTRQKVQEKCESCGARFGKYTCLICNLFDDEDKNQYHCDECGICRIGGRDNFFHCAVCNMCLPIQLKIQGHRCVENISRSNCPVCLGAIHTSRIPCHIPDCGHLLHKMCFDQLLTSGHYVCPICQTSLIDMTNLWEYLDAQALLIPIPKKYEEKIVHIFCNDCHKTSETKFHFIGLKCMHCGAYNTTQDVKRRISWVSDDSTSA